MTTIAGASSYLNAARLANSQGIAAAAPTLLGNNVSETSLLDAGRSSLLSPGGPGLSSNGRALNQQFLNSTRSGFNQLLSLAAGTDSTIEGLQTSILALQASLPDSAISKYAAGREESDSSSLGRAVDEEA